jgi:DnaK suppressor protein
LFTIYATKGLKNAFLFIYKNMPISAEILNQIKQDLQSRRNQILKDLQGISKKDDHEKDQHRAFFPEYGDKIDENAQEISEYSTNLATEKILEATLRDIETAIVRIEKNTYGICKYCGKEINEKRLLARPVASACIECKTKLQSS